METVPREVRKGVVYGLLAYGAWGFFPVYFKALGPVPPTEVLAHRIVWSFLFLAVLLTATRRWTAVRALVAAPRTLLLLGCTAALIATNWLVYIFAVGHARILESSLGYFINPLMNVLLGYLFLGERLRRWQGVSLALATAGVAFMVLRHGSVPWVALTLAATFATYGLLRKLADARALEGLTVETGVLFPFALGLLAWRGATGEGAFSAGSPRISLLLALAGVITATPLLWFAGAARRVSLASLGFMQYLSPTLQFLLAVCAFGEPFTEVHLVSFGLIWSGLVVYSTDAWSHAG